MHCPSRAIAWRCANEITFEICNTVHPGDGCTVRFWQYGSKCCWRNISLGHYQLDFPGWRSHGQYWRVALRVGGRPAVDSNQWPRYLRRGTFTNRLRPPSDIGPFSPTFPLGELHVYRYRAATSRWS